MLYPKRLVKRFGAKAGYLMYVAEHLPDIPQTDMIVSPPGESVDDALNRAEETGILWPRVFRSSAVEELTGYEGDFYTFEAESFEEGNAGIVNPNYYGPYRDTGRFDEWIRSQFLRVRESTQWLKEEGAHSHLPDEIAVMITEKSPSRYFGTLIKHPNQDDVYLISVTDAETQDVQGRGKGFIDDPLHATFGFDPEGGLRELELFSGYLKLEENHDALRDLERVVEWHDRMTGLPRVDNGWSYQLEFGLDPACLYQIRPFKPVENADFRVINDSEATLDKGPLVIGVTPERGLNYVVEREVWKRVCADEPINERRVPACFIGEMRSALSSDELPNHQANILGYAHGMLAHRDIKAMRHAGVTVLLYHHPPEYEQGDRIKIRSDGKNVQILPLK